MKVFLSWSGERSRHAAEALRQWLPDLVSFFEPWLSSEDVDKGARWQAELATQLQQTNVGIVCVTSENRESPWLLFEAGALSNALQRERVCTYLIDVTPAELDGPLVQFQASRATREDTFRLVKSLNALLHEGARRSDLQLERIFNQWWPSLEARLESPPAMELSAKPKRTDRQLLEELLLITRQRAKVDTLAIAELADYFGAVTDMFEGPDVIAFEKSTSLIGGSDDPNAESWPSVTAAGLELNRLSGLWASRWTWKAAPGGWITGSAAVAVHDRYFAFINADNRFSTLVIGKRDGARLRGREYNIETRRDSGPFVGLIVSNARIDGAWSHGRFDLRRVDTAAG